MLEIQYPKLKYLLEGVDLCILINPQPCEL